MKSKEQIKLEIEKLKNEKEDLRYSLRIDLDAFLILFVFYGTIVATVLLAVEAEIRLILFLLFDVVALVAGLIVLFIVFKKEKKSDKTSLKINNLYDKLIKNETNNKAKK